MPILKKNRSNLRRGTTCSVRKYKNKICHEIFLYFDLRTWEGETGVNLKRAADGTVFAFRT